MCEGTADKIETRVRCSSESYLLTGKQIQLFTYSGGFQAESSRIWHVCARERHRLHSPMLTLPSLRWRRKVSTWMGKGCCEDDEHVPYKSSGRKPQLPKLCRWVRHISPQTCVKKSCSLQWTAALDSLSICLIYGKNDEETSLLWMCCKLTTCT